MIFQKTISVIAMFFNIVYVMGQSIVSVPADSDWVPTGFTRASNEEVILCSGGEVRGWSEQSTECWRFVTPSGIGRPNFTSTQVPCTSCPVLSLIAKIGTNGTPFYVGDRCVIEPSITSEAGEIFLRINDSSISDNSGEWQVAIAQSCDDLTSCFEPITPTLGTTVVSGSSGWSATGVSRLPGEEIIICGNGNIKAWSTLETDCWRTITPAGLGRFNYTSTSTPCPTCPVLSLIGKIGQNGIPFYIGERGVIQALDTSSGEFFLRINDASLSDNSGEWSVSIVKSCAEISICFAEQVVNSDEATEFSKDDIIKVFPNPTEISSNLQIQISNQSLILINIFDITGTLLSSEEHTLSRGAHTLPLILKQITNNQFVIIQTILDEKIYSIPLMLK
jgi:hypothetical protein